MNRIKHQEIGGGHSSERKIIIDCTEIEGTFEVMAIRQKSNMFLDDEELDCEICYSERDALLAFDRILKKYLLPLQQAVFSAGMKPGERYTLLRFSEFGFPVVHKFTLHEVRCTTYAQYGDVASLRITPYRKRSLCALTLYNQSFAIFKGWQDLDSNLWNETVRKGNGIKVERTKYACFDYRFFEECQTALKNPLVVYKHYQTGTNGMVYA